MRKRLTDIAHSRRSGPFCLHLARRNDAPDSFQVYLARFFLRSGREFCSRCGEEAQGIAEMVESGVYLAESFLDLAGIASWTTTWLVSYEAAERT